MKNSIRIYCIIAFAVFTSICCGFFLARTSMVPSVEIQRITHSVSADAPTAHATAIIDINTASLAQLTDLPGIGDTIAQRIIAYREENGPFHQVDELIHVDGIGEKKLTAILPYIMIGGNTNEDISR